MAIVIPNPYDLHRKVMATVAEVPLEETGLCKSVTQQMNNTSGLMFNAIKINGNITQEYLQFYVANSKNYLDGLRILREYWECGFYCHVSRTANCDTLGLQKGGLCAMTICWDPKVIASRGDPCPCIMCNAIGQRKLVCPGCDAWKMWLKNGRFEVSSKEMPVEVCQQFDFDEAEELAAEEESAPIMEEEVIAQNIPDAECEAEVGEGTISSEMQEVSTEEVDSTGVMPETAAG